MKSSSHEPVAGWEGHLERVGEWVVRRLEWWDSHMTRPLDDVAFVLYLAILGAVIAAVVFDVGLLAWWLARQAWHIAGG